MTLLVSDLHHRRPRASPKQQQETNLAVPNGGEDLKDSKKTRRKKRRRRYENNSNDDSNGSFLLLFLQTGATLAVICFIVWSIYRHFYPYVELVVPFYDDDDDNFASPNTEGNNNFNANPQGDGGGALKDVLIPPVEGEEDIIIEAMAVMEKTIPPLPVWNLTAAIVDFDAFGIAQRFAPINDATFDLHNDLGRFWLASKGLRRDFAELYGGENAARALLERGMSTFGKPSTKSTAADDTTQSSSSSSSSIPTDLLHTACRMDQARRQERPFSFAFGGYSVTVGRGNFFSQSFPLVMEKQLHTVFQLLLGQPLQVRNAAIGGCPSFPYGWCMSNFWGTQPDVVSWDFSMNEQGPDGLEAYVRHVLQLPHQPKLIVKDTHMATERRQVLDNYVQLANQQNKKPDPQQALLSLHDPVVLHTDPATDPFLALPEEHRPIGFREWRKFGGPPGAPGQALHHPAIKEHEMLAWTLTMHFLAALELVAASLSTSTNGSTAFHLDCPATPSDSQQQQHGGSFLPRPSIEHAANSTKPWSSILYGQPSTQQHSPNASLTSSPPLWTMNPVYCRTTFEPLVEGDLSHIVAWGGVAEDLDVMLPKSKMYYNRGWVLDLSESEKRAKRNLQVHGNGLGFVDNKKAYYGLVTSHVLSLLLPYQPSPSSQSQQQQEQESPKIGDKALDWFQSVVICQVNEKDRPMGACDLGKDVHVNVGGVNSTTTAIMMDAVGTMYLGKQLCLYLPVATNATLTNRKLLIQQAQANMTQKYQFPDQDKQESSSNKFQPGSDQDDTAVGLGVELHVFNQHIVQREHACSVSHVVWEQQQRPPQRFQQQPKETAARVD